MKKLLIIAFTLVMVLGLAAASAASYAGYTEEEFAALDKTTVIRSDDSPTGYYVTFRYPAPEAKRVRIYGEWAFTDPHYAGLNQSMDAKPEEWQNGYVTFATAWPTNEMVKNEETGVWSYTIPLPSGTWLYRFYVDGAEGAELTDFTDAVRTWDPNNIPTIYDYEAELSNDESSSEIFVPYDPKKQSLSLDASVEAPRADQNGEVTFASVKVANDADASFGIYLPYGFDAKREQPYKVLILTHGGGGTESSWIMQGALANIMDNMIAEGKVEPTVVVTPNLSDFPSEQHIFDRPVIMDNILNYILPYMVEHYNVSTDSADRAMGGLSMGGATTYYALFNHTDAFSYYIPMSGFVSKEYTADYTMDALKEVKICIGCGLYDFCLSDTGFDFMAENKNLTIMSNFTSNGISYVSDLVQSGHTWVTWRHNLAWMLENFLWK